MPLKSQQSYTHRRKSGAVDKGIESDDPCVHHAAAALDLKALKALPTSIVRSERQTFYTNDHGQRTWAITKAIRSEVQGKTMQDRIAVFDYLVTHGSSLDGALVFAGWKGHCELMKHILEKYKDKVDVNGRVPLANRNVDGTGNGETCIHAALISASWTGKYDIVKELISDNGAGVNEAYDKDDSEYRGETALHIACVNAPLHMVKFLVDNHANLEAEIHPDANFFTGPDSSQLAGMGFVPLTFAASCCREEIVEYLLLNGANINWRDNDGRTVFHHLAMRTNRSSQDRMRVVKVMEQHLTKSGLQVSDNLADIDKEGLTPVVYAAMRGDKQFCEQLIEHSRRMLWSFDTISSFSYPLHLLDGACDLIEFHSYPKTYPGSGSGSGGITAKISPDAPGVNYKQKEQWEKDKDNLYLRLDKSVLDVLLNTNDIDKLELFNIPILRFLIDKKWETYGRWIHFKNTLCYVAMVIFLSTAVIQLAPFRRAGVERWDYDFSNWNDVLRILSESLSLVFAAFYAKNEITDMQKVGLNKYMQGTAGWPYAVNVYWMSMVMTLVCRLLHSDVEDIFLSITCMAATVYFLYFLTSVEVPIGWNEKTKSFVWRDLALGKMIIMMFRMLYDDLAKFMLLWFVIMLGFCAAFMILFMESLQLLDPEASASDAVGNLTAALAEAAEPPDYSEHMFYHWGKGLLSMWRLSLGDFEYANFDRAEDSVTRKFVYMMMWFAALMILAVLLLNMLIAMMSTTFATCEEMTELQAYHARARVIRTIEHQLSNRRLKEVYEKDFTSKHEIITPQSMDTDSEWQKEAERDQKAIKRMDKIEGLLHQVLKNQQAAMPQQKPQMSVEESLLQELEN